MELAVPLVALGGLYVAANQENKKEGYENKKSIEEYGNIKVLGQISSINHITKRKIETLSKKRFINVFKL